MKFKTVFFAFCFTAFICSCQSEVDQQTDSSTEEVSTQAIPGNFAHVVYFWLKDPGNEAHRKQFEDAASKLTKDSKYIQASYIAKPVESDREVVDDSWTYQFIFYFDSNEQQQQYQEEEAHLTFIEEAQDVWEKVIVYDGLSLDE